MSYSGFTELLCLRGHYSGHDAFEATPEKCHCGAYFRWSHGVDETNGYDNSHPSSCRAPKGQIGSEDEWHVDPYGNRYATIVPLFAPKGGGIWICINSRGQAVSAYPDDLASADTHPKDGDVKQAPLVSGAVPERQTPDV